MAQEGCSGGGEGKQVGDDGEPLFTVSEFLEELEEKEKEAEMVLGGGDSGDVCSYDEGYLPRQGVFVCETCTPNAQAGVCLACSLTCHDKHEIVEIWTRRRFRCDCGNSKFGGVPCKLRPDKDPINPKNVYNQNYRGVYCICHRPYPDPERAERDEEERMIQCTICEDWFHEEHLGIPTDQLPHEDDSASEDFICGGCVAQRVPFIEEYPELRLFPLPAPPPPCQGSGGVVENGDATVKGEPSGEPSSGMETNGGSHVNDQGMKTEEEDAAGAAKGVECERNGKMPVCKNGSDMAVSGEHSGLEPSLAVLKAENEDDDRRRLSQGQIGCKRKRRDCRIHYCANGGSTPVAELDSKRTGNGTAGHFHQNAASTCISVANGQTGPCEVRAHGNGVVAGADCDSGTKREVSGSLLQDIKGDHHPANGSITERLMENPRALFLKKDWRLELCHCDGCCAMYRQIGVDFLLDPEDTMQMYQEKGKAKTEQRKQEIEQVQNNLWNSLGRTGQVEFLHGFNDLAENLRSFLMPFGQSGQPVTEQDVRGFFEQLKDRRRRLS
ncbi:hypothetical protein CBR_g50475 [Chara braunii]|uniref:UBR-type domain-containing protein n=1 Tax=Chara braunii TaxID=69332 RepID=A0A388M6S2_CHABU|nr:hypothetical protein CBR_g50475 [Chara braunii]|eukprot:GBG90297.1 hypothetical protein CBR_g50475 [Chara braunii]